MRIAPCLKSKLSALRAEQTTRQWKLKDPYCWNKQREATYPKNNRSVRALLLSTQESRVKAEMTNNSAQDMIIPEIQSSLTDIPLDTNPTANTNSDNRIG